jgi:hypothetical protein
MMEIQQLAGMRTGTTKWYTNAKNGYPMMSGSVAIHVSASNEHLEANLQALP